MKLSLRHALPALLLLISSTAHAQDVTFNVPVDVKSLAPPIKEVAVYCRLFAAGSTTQQIAAGYSPFVALDANGNYKGTLTVKLSGATPGQVPNYRCSLTLAYADRTVYSNDLIANPAKDEFGKPQPNTPYVPVVGIGVTTPGTAGAGGSGPAGGTAPGTGAASSGSGSPSSGSASS
jgi:hypothetical protein